MVDVKALEHAFAESYGAKPRVWSAPGRVNLIGEHTDYNEGFVLPVAINLRTFVAATPREDRRVLIRSLDLSETAEFDLDRPAMMRPGEWLNYIEGTARVIERRGTHLRGANLAIASDVPAGAGLSSSAALEVATGLAFTVLSGEPVNRVELALAAQEAEHVYVGTKCGIMDQLSSSLARQDHALLIDCRSLELAPIPLHLGEMAIVICDTKKKHKLAASAYNTRRAECERGVEILRELLPDISALRDVGVEEFAQHEMRLPVTIRKRCRHVVTENARTLEAADALRRGATDVLGQLMLQSHQSLRDDFEVSSPELNLLVDFAMACEKVKGARMTGGGFGGCTVQLVNHHALEEFQTVVSRQYLEATGIAPDIYVIEADDGGKELEKFQENVVR